MMQKRIVKVSPMAHGHLMLEFSDGTKQTVFRGDHEQHAPKVGELWPPEGHEHVQSGLYSGKLQRKAAPPAPVNPEDESK